MFHQRLPTTRTPRLWLLAGFSLFAAGCEQVASDVTGDDSPADVSLNESPVDVARIEFHDGAEPVAMELGDRAELENLLDICRRGQANEDHKCADLAQLNFQHADGRETALALLPGHDDAFYEFRFEGQNFRIDRAETLRVLGSLGIDTERLLRLP